MTLAALMSAVGVTKSKLADQRIVVYGAGTAGLGITKQLRDGLVAIDRLSREDANKRFFLLDRYGLVKESLGPPQIRENLREFVRSDAEWTGVPTNDKGEVRLWDVASGKASVLRHTARTYRFHRTCLYTHASCRWPAV